MGFRLTINNPVDTNISMQEEYKQVLVLRKDLKMSKGKTAVQAAHASVEAYKKADAESKREWEKQGSKKVAVLVDSLAELMEIRKRVAQLGISTSLIRDAGRTELPAGTVTALGIAPCKSGKIDKVTGKLKML